MNTQTGRRARTSTRDFKWGGRGAVGVLGLLLLLGTVWGAQAQSVRIGVRAGPTFGFLNNNDVPFLSATGDPRVRSNVRIDAHVGGYGVVPLTDRLSAQMEVLYVRKGGHFSRAERIRYTVEQYQLSYLEGQLLARRAIALSGPLSLHVVAGGFVGRALDAAAQRNVNAQVTSTKEEMDLFGTGRLRRWDVGSVLGAGLSYPVGGARRVALTIRLAPGMRTVFDEGGCSSSCPVLPRMLSSLRHDVVTASVSYTVPLGR